MCEDLKTQQSIKYYTKLERTCNERIKGLNIKLKNALAINASDIEINWIKQEIVHQENTLSTTMRSLKKLKGVC